MEKLLGFVTILTRKDIGPDTKSKCHTQLIASVIFLITSAIMTIQNIRSHSTHMLYATLILVVGFCITIYFSGIRKKSKPSSLIILVLVAFIMTYFALSGGNEGFAILWIMLVPVCAITLFGFYGGIALATYFLLFLIVLFYTPLRACVAGKYTAAMIDRFPVLYLCNYVLSMYLSMQKEFYSRKLQLGAYIDELTGVYNRNRFLQKLEDTDYTSRKNFNIAIMDLNGLKVINDNLGHEAGDELLRGIAEICIGSFREDGDVFRLGGDEFAVISFLPVEGMGLRMRTVKARAAQWQGAVCPSLDVASGWVSRQEYPELSAGELMKIADARMYEDKQRFYQQHIDDWLT